MSFRLVLFIFWAFLSSLSTLHAATITINVLDDAGVGFNDTTAATPVGGNTGTTVGAQRLQAFEHVADQIGAYLDSNVPIVIDASFAGLPCTANAGTLGSAGAQGLFRDFPNAPESNTFYPSALANALANTDLDSSQSDIEANFNGNLGNSGCLEDSSWYYGFDHNEPSGSIDFIAVLTHELIHGLGFSSFADVTTGAFPSPFNPTFAGIFDKFIVDTEQRKLWDSMSNSERVAAAINDPDLIWKGDNVNAAARYLTNGTSNVDIVTVNGSPTTLKGTFVRLYAPNPVEVGSSVSHFTNAASPNLLMEPAVNSDLFSSKIDLSQQLLKDLGWPFQDSSLSEISVALNSSVNSVLTGGNFDYLVTVSNSMQASAELIKMNLVLPTGANYQSASGSGWTCAATMTSPVEVNCDLDAAIANGQSSAQLSISTTAPSTGSGSITATATAATITTESNVNNNTATKDVTLINNSAPVATDGNITTTENNAVSDTLSATDANNNSLTFSLVSNGTKGTANITNASTGAFTYTPNSGQTGQDSFTFKANDGFVDSNTATVNVTINVADNTIPVANNGTLTTAENSAKSGTLSATDDDNDSLTFSIVSNATKGTVEITDTATGAFTYTPNMGQSGTDSFTFKANDGTVDSNTATVSITINAKPIASNASFDTAKNTAISNTLSASDPENSALTFSIVSNGSKGAATLTNTSTGAFTYTPTTGQSGTDTFTFKANDGVSDSNTATITINIINTTPVANNGTLMTTENSAKSGTLSATDDDNDSLTFSIVSNATKGTVEITNTATGAFTYTPNMGQSGTDSFTFKANDGTVDSNTATVSITINAKPIASNASFDTAKNTAISNTLSAGDPENSALTFSIVSNGSKGAVTLTNASTGAFTYTPTTGQSGADTFTFKANDGATDSNTATVTINIINTTPVATNSTITTNVATAVSGTLLGSDADTDNLTFSIVSNGTGTVEITDTATGAFTYTPANEVTVAAQDSFTFKANDGDIDSNTATVTVNINSTQTATSPLDGDINVSSSEVGSKITELTVLDDNADLITSQAATMPANTTFPHDFIAYKVTGVTAGATVSINITFPSIPDNPKFFKVDATNGFVEFTNFTISGNTVTITITDGGTGDADGIANGVIDDPLGLAASTASTPTGGNTLSGGGGGGSFDILFLIALLTLYGMRRYRQQQT